MEATAILIILAIFLVAVLYSSVGHGGASGYLAVMAFLAVAPEVTRPTALLLNLFVASIGAFQFWRAGYFSWVLFWPFAATSVPFAFIGGLIHLPTDVYKIVLGVVLVLAAFRLAWKLASGSEIKQPNIAICLGIGAVIGLLSGLVGVGGGIFLTPILLLMNWSETRTAAGVSAVFIFVNSFSGIVGHTYALVTEMPSDAAFWPFLPWDTVTWIAAAVAGGILGSTFGAKKFDSLVLRRLLAAVLLIAGAKLILA